jgi:hypothetical protein
MAKSAVLPPREPLEDQEANPGPASYKSRKVCLWNILWETLGPNFQRVFKG